MTQIARSEEVEVIRAGLADWPVTVLLGPRQCGKTTLVRPFATSPDHYFDIHDFVDQVRLEDSNYRILDGLDGTVVIDEAQERPALFQKMRVLADRKDRNTRFILTGSASPSLYQGASESLAGRARLLSLSGFSLSEIDPDNWERLWLRGGYPISYLRELEENSMEWRQNYITQFLGRDLPALAETKLTTEQLRRFFLLLAHHHGQYWNHSEIATTLGVNYKTIQRHVDLFKGAYLLRELSPFHNNAKKRLRKAPKIYLRDSGLLHTLLGIRNLSQLYASPQLGASWEGFGIEQVISILKAREEECFTWSVQGGAEVDLVLQLSDKPIGFEFKAADAPRRTRSMTSAVESLGLRKLFVIYPGDKDYALDESINVVSIKNIRKLRAMCDD
jgi:predicted AAA+ superfamily ATPase